MEITAHPATPQNYCQTHGVGHNEAEETCMPAFSLRLVLQLEPYSVA
jgi:hypothetical protein